MGSTSSEGINGDRKKATANANVVVIVVDVVVDVVAGAFGRGPGRPGARTITVPERVGYQENTMPSPIIITIIERGKVQHHPPVLRTHVRISINEKKKREQQQQQNKKHQQKK